MTGKLRGVSSSSLNTSGVLGRGEGFIQPPPLSPPPCRMYGIIEMHIRVRYSETFGREIRGIDLGFAFNTLEKRDVSVVRLVSARFVLVFCGILVECQQEKWEVIYMIGKTPDPRLLIFVTIINPSKLSNCVLLFYLANLIEIARNECAKLLGNINAYVYVLIRSNCSFLTQTRSTKYNELRRE